VSSSHFIICSAKAHFRPCTPQRYSAIGFYHAVFSFLPWIPKLPCCRSMNLTTFFSVHPVPFCLIKQVTFCSTHPAAFCCHLLFDKPGHLFFAKPSHLLFDKPGHLFFAKPSHLLFDKPLHLFFDKPSHLLFDKSGHLFKSSHLLFDKPGHLFFDKPSHLLFDKRNHRPFGRQNLITPGLKGSILYSSAF